MVNIDQDNAAAPRKGWVRDEVWVPYGKRLEPDGRLFIMARNQKGWETLFPIHQWRDMPLAEESK